MIFQRGWNHQPVKKWGMNLNSGQWNLLGRCFLSATATTATTQPRCTSSKGWFYTHRWGCRQGQEPKHRASECFRQLIELCLSRPLDSHLLIIPARGLEFRAGFGSLFRSLAQDQSIVETGPCVTLVSWHMLQVKVGASESFWWAQVRLGPFRSL